MFLRAVFIKLPEDLRPNRYGGKRREGQSLPGNYEDDERRFFMNLFSVALRSGSAKRSQIF